MRKPVLLVLFFAISFIASAQTRDVPVPTANLQTLTAGSYVIAMDNTLQANAAGNFNLKTYGLVVHLLNNNIKVKWSIKAGKSKDGIDFTAMAEQFQPTLVAGGVSTNFKAGPFVIYAADTTGVASLITAYYTATGLTGNNRPKVYRLTAAASNVDIRYDMDGFRPKANIMTDGGNQNIHVGYMTDCGITTANYRTGPAIDLVTKCYTFASEAHSTVTSSATLNAINSFVNYGGNFLAQCAAIETFENNAGGRFHTTNGITVVNTNVTAATTIYPNADLAFSQYEGVFDIKQGGSVSNWVLASGSTFKNNEHNHATGGTVVTQTPIGASVAKLNGTVLLGGLVFYLGNHDFSSVTSIESINGIRMYMNAFLTPVAININCSTGGSLPNPLPIKLISFTASLDQIQSKVNLAWTTATEINTSHFLVERSLDGINYTNAAMIFANGNTNDKNNYSYADNISGVKATVIYYRLHSVDVDGKGEYSETRLIRLDKQTEDKISILAFPNPVTSELRISIPAGWQNKKVTYEIVNTNGQVQQRRETTSSSQVESINTNNLSKGLYWVRAICEGRTAQQKIVKQ